MVEASGLITAIAALIAAIAALVKACKSSAPAPQPLVFLIFIEEKWQPDVLAKADTSGESAGAGTKRQKPHLHTYDFHVCSPRKQDT